MTTTMIIAIQMQVVVKHATCLVEMDTKWSVVGKT